MHTTGIATASAYAVATPPDAVTVSEWEADNGQAFRTFTGSSWRVPFTVDVDLFGTGPDIEITIHGHQFADGPCTRWVVRGDLPEDIPLATLRMLTDSFAAAHAEIDRLAQPNASAFPVFSHAVA